MRTWAFLLSEREVMEGFDAEEWGESDFCSDRLSLITMNNGSEEELSDPG